MFTVNFWKETAERAVKSFAQAILLTWGVGDVMLSVWEVDWMTVLGFGLGGAAISVLTSIASGAVTAGGKGSPSLV